MSEIPSTEKPNPLVEDQKDDHAGPGQGLARPIVLTLCLMLLGMLLCEWLLGILQPGPISWSYRLAAVVFAALLASLIVYFMIRKKDALFQEVKEQGSRLMQSEVSLQNSCLALETQVTKQTGELKTAHEQLMEEREKRRHLEQALHESEDKTRNILNSIEDGFFEVDLAGNFTSYNGSLCKIVGYSREELRGMNYRVYSKENSDKVFAAFNRVYKTGDPVKEFDWEIITKNGEKRYVEASISLIENSGTEARGFRGIVRDSTERKATEEKIKELLHAFGKIWTK